MADLLNYLGQSFTILGLWLNHATSPIPWPLVIAFLFLPIVAIFRTTLWVARGTLWPVKCKYFHTQQRRADKPCRTPVLGEWHYCLHHRKRKVMSDGHVCDPALQRWQARLRGGKLVERSDIRGAGFVQLISNRETLLFYKGIARRPRDVTPGLLPRELKRRWRQGAERIRHLRPQDIIKRSDETPLGVAERMPRVIIATRTSLIAYVIGLIAVGASITVSGGSQTMEQYNAAAAFIISWNSFRFGVWKDEAKESRWIHTTCIDSGKAFGVLVALALSGNTLSDLKKSVRPQ